MLQNLLSRRLFSTFNACYFPRVRQSIASGEKIGRLSSVIPAESILKPSIDQNGAQMPPKSALEIPHKLIKTGEDGFAKITQFGKAEKGEMETILEKGEEKIKGKTNKEKNKITPVDPEGFKRFPLRPDVLAGIGAMGLSKPTHVQELVIPQLLKGSNCLVAAETGSGKTLAYVLPILNQIKNEEQNEGLIRRKSFPRVLVLLPTRELVQQVLGVVKFWSHFVKIRAVGLLGGTKKGLEEDKLDSEVDVVISTPARFLAHRARDNVFIGDIKHLVLDEADTLFRDDFFVDVKKIIQSVLKKSSLTNTTRQIITVSATLPKDITSAIDNIIPDIKHITTPLLHRAPPRIKQRFIPVPSQGGGKQSLLVETLRMNQSNKTIIFCNSIKTCEALQSFLKKEGYPSIHFHKYMTFEDRKKHFEDFTSGETMLLITTDIGSRGLDTTMVDHVIMYDFPKKWNRLFASCWSDRSGK